MFSIKSKIQTSLLFLLLCTTGTGYLQAQACNAPDVPILTADNYTICQGKTVQITINGNLNDGTYWSHYTGSCGGTYIGAGGPVIFRTPSTTTTYYIRGEGGCVTPGACGSITINVIPDPTPPTISCGGSVTDTLESWACSLSVTVPTPTYNDNCGVASITNDYNGSSDASGAYPIGHTVITWTVTDHAGNTANCTQDVYVMQGDDDCDGICNVNDTDDISELRRANMLHLPDDSLGPGALIMGHSSNLDFSQFNDFSIECWFRSGLNQANAQIIGKYDGTSGNMRGWSLRLNGQQPEFYMGFDPGDAMLSIPAGSPNITDDQWHHLAVTYDGSNSPFGFHFYIDGIDYPGVDGGLSMMVGGTVSTSDSLVIGGYLNGPVLTGTLDAYLEEMRIWNHVRSMAEVRENMHLSLSGPCNTNILGYWKFNKRSGTTVRDVSSFGLDGTLTGTAYLQRSQASVGKGKAVTINATQTGVTYTCPSRWASREKLRITFDGSSPQGDIVVTFLDTLPVGKQPTGFHELLSETHWVIDNYGLVQSGLGAKIGFWDMNYSVLNPNEADYDLYKRGSREYRSGDWIQTHSAADSIHNHWSYGMIEFESVQSFSMFWPTMLYNPFPIELTEFLAFPEGREHVRVSWVTASESNVDHFEVQHSRDGESWEAIGNRSPKGGEDILTSYDLLHDSPVRGRNHYRLRSVDRDGEEDFSEIRTVDFDPLDQRVGLSVFPNPVGEAFSIVPMGMEPGQPLHLELLDLQGRLLWSRDLSGEESYPLRLARPAVAQGIYLLRLRGGGASAFQKVMFH